MKTCQKNLDHTKIIFFKFRLYDITTDDDLMKSLHRDQSCNGQQRLASLVESSPPTPPPPPEPLAGPLRVQTEHFSYVICVFNGNRCFWGPRRPAIQAPGEQIGTRRRQKHTHNFLEKRNARDPQNSATPGSARRLLFFCPLLSSILRDG